MKPRVARHAVEQPLDDSYRLIPLTQHQTAKVSTCDYEYLSQFNWFAQKHGHTTSVYACRTSFDNGKKGVVMMHRVVLGCINPKDEVDHHNHDTLDNRRDNLRKCTRAQNSYNRKMQKNISGLRGVRFRWNHWYAEFEFKGKCVYIGSFNTKEEAVKAHAEALKKYHGEFASPAILQNLKALPARLAPEGSQIPVQD